MAHPVVHFEIGSRDAQRSAEFYEDLFGWTISAAGPNYWLVAGEEPGIGGGLMQASGEIPPYVTVYVATEALDETLERALSLGARQLVPPTEIPGMGRFAMFQDLDDNAIGLIEEAAAG